MEDLRWILLLLGGLVIAAVYFSSRFEREDWVREREQFDARKASSKKRSTKPARRQPVAREMVAQEATAPLTEKSRKEPQMASLDVELESIADEYVSVTQIVDTQIVDTEKTLVEPTEEPQKALKVESIVIEDSETEPTSQEVSSPLPEESEKPEGKGAPSHDHADEQPAEVEAASSEIPTEVLLEEETVSELLEEPENPQHQEVDVQADVEMPELFIAQGIEDEITGVEIPADLAIAEAEIHTAQHTESQPQKSSESALPPNVEPLVLVLSIMAEDELFAGPAVQEALEAEGLRHGEMRIFHCFDESLDAETAENNANLDGVIPIFSVASLVEPGYFELDKIHDMEIPGLTLFCQLPGPVSGKEAFEIMLDKGRGIAVRLHGHLCDDKRNRFTTQAKTLYKDRIETFNRELVLAKKKDGA